MSGSAVSPDSVIESPPSAEASPGDRLLFASKDDPGGTFFDEHPSVVLLYTRLVLFKKCAKETKTIGAHNYPQCLVKLYYSTRL